MEIGIDRFITAHVETSRHPAQASRNPMIEVIEEAELADQVGIAAFGIGEHYTSEFLDSAPVVLLGGIAARTTHIRLTSAVTVLSAADPVRVFQQFATLDILSGGRAEIIAGRGSSVEAFSLFGLDLEDYDDIFAEKLGLLLRLRQESTIEWSGSYRPLLNGQGVYPRPLQSPLPVWLGVGGTQASFIRAGSLGLPLAMVVLGGDYSEYRPMVDLYREAGRRAGHSPDRLLVGLHAVGYVAETAKKARDEFFPGYLETFGAIARKQGWAPLSRRDFDTLTGNTGALIVGEPAEIVQKLIYISDLLGGVSRVSLQMKVGSLVRNKLLHAITLLGEHVAAEMVSVGSQAFARSK